MALVLSFVLLQAASAIADEKVTQSIDINKMMAEQGVREVNAEGGADIASMMSGGGGMMPPSAPAFKAVSADVPFIMCDACKALARRAAWRAPKYVADRLVKKYGKPSEQDFSLLVSLMCDVEGKIPTPQGDLPHHEGEWLHELDIVESEDGTALKLKRQSTAGECGTECHTIGAACSAVLDEASDDLAESMYMQRYDGKGMAKAMCTEWTDFCTRNLAPLPMSRVPGGDNFVAKKKAAKPVAESATKTKTKTKKKKKKKRKKKKKKTKKTTNTKKQDKAEL